MIVTQPRDTQDLLLALIDILAWLYHNLFCVQKALLTTNVVLQLVQNSRWIRELSERDESAFRGNRKLTAEQTDPMAALLQPWISIRYQDQISGTKANRPGLDMALEVLRKNDTLVVWKLDRLGRTVKGAFQSSFLFYQIHWAHQKT